MSKLNGSTSSTTTIPFPFLTGLLTRPVGDNQLVGGLEPLEGCEMLQVLYAASYSASYAAVTQLVTHLVALQLLPRTGLWGYPRSRVVAEHTPNSAGALRSWQPTQRQPRTARELHGAPGFRSR